jgi:eukaryotic-like serine/threonine-protein kinase
VAYMSRVMQGLPSIGFPEPPKPPEGPVPSVIGMTKKEAITTLSEAGFRASIEMADSLSRKGRAFSQSPGGGSVTALGTLVTVQISTGEPAQVPMPRVVGMRGFDAKNALEALGLVVTTVRVEAGDPNKIGFVIAQEPRSQSFVVQGDTVTIFIGTAKTAKGGGADGGGNGGGGGGGGG